MGSSPPTRRRSRRPADQYQLALPLAWLTEAEFIDAMRTRGVAGIRRVRYRPNRSRLVSLSANRSTLNLHECFRGATEPVLDAIAVFLRDDGRMEQRLAIEIMRSWSEGQTPCDAFGVAARSGSPSAGTREQMAFLTAAYRHFNRARFHGCLPENVSMRLSQRMIRRFGHVEYHRRRQDARAIAEIAINIDLLLEGNERPLIDTLLHEMAHIEAWIVHGHRGHGEPWERIAERVGCEVNSHSHVRIRRRRNGADVTRVPDLDALIESVSRPTKGRRDAGLRRFAPFS
jgi:predicted SprT family Zn-dependent metalloprotease